MRRGIHRMDTYPPHDRMQLAEAQTQWVDHATQRERISRLLKSEFRQGDTWYLIDSGWFKRWKKHVGYDTTNQTPNVLNEEMNPGPIDNGPLYKEGSSETLKEKLIEQLDYMLLPEDGWSALLSWYGTIPGQVPFARKVVVQGFFVKLLKVEVYLMDLKLSSLSRPNHFITEKFSRSDTIGTIENKMKEIFGVIAGEEVRLWKKYMSNIYEHLSCKDTTVQDAELYQFQVIILEQKNNDGSWPRDGSSPQQSGTPVAVKPKEIATSKDDAGTPQKVKEENFDGTKDKRQLTECHICLDDMTDRRPRALPCLHTFCEECVTSLCSQSEQQRSMVKCPVCRKESKLPQGGAKALPVNFMVSMVAPTKVTTAGDSCVSCFENKGATQAAKVYCIDCERRLCGKCWDQHNRILDFESHRFTKVGESSEEILSCSPHGKKVTHYCQKCMVGICVDCAIGDAHNQHAESIGNLQKDAAKLRFSAKQLFDKARADINKHEKECIIDKMEKSYQSLELAIKNHGEQHKKTIDESVANLLNSLAVAKSKSEDAFTQESNAVSAQYTSLLERLRSLSDETMDNQLVARGQQELTTIKGSLEEIQQRCNSIVPGQPVFHPSPVTGIGMLTF